jgi:hypothetical protein
MRIQRATPACGTHGLWLAGINAGRDQASASQDDGKRRPGRLDGGIRPKAHSIGNRERLLPYDPELIGWFFMVDCDLAIYLILIPPQATAAEPATPERGPRASGVD